MSASERTSLAPESGASVQAACKALMDEAGRLEAVGDPMASMLKAMAMSTEANYRLSVDTTATLGALVGEARRPMTLTEMNDMARLIDQRSARRWVMMNRWGVGICTAAVLMFGAACWGLSEWHHAWTDRPLIGIDAGAGSQMCKPVAKDGSQLCYLPVWRTPPPTPEKH